MINEKYIVPVFETKSEKTEWFGYYNYDVLNHDGKKMLCGRTDFDARQITDKDQLELGWYDIDTGEWHDIATTDSFNWQQGAMLQWLPGKGNENKVVYNFSNGDHYQSCITDIVSGEKRIINFPVYCITPDGRYSISLNYERSYWCRAYHYQPIKNPAYDVRVAEDDGIFCVDLEKNQVTRIVDINDVIRLDEQPDFAQAKHWLEHIMISPSGTRFVFLHRFSYGNAYETRICIANIDGSGLQLIDGWKSNLWSHFGWKGDDAFVIYSVKRNSFQASYAKGVQKAKNTFSIMSIVNWVVHTIIPKKIKDYLKPNEKYYALYEYKDGAFVFTDRYEGKLLSIDGHPSFTKDGRYMITDSYPDENGEQRLIIYDTLTKKGVLVARFPAPLSGNPASCDLHPKLSSNGKYVVVDSAYIGRHRMLVFRIKWDEVKASLK